MSSPGREILTYILFISVLIAACAGVSATGRLTLSLLASLAALWMFVPLLHVAVAAVIVFSARGRRVSAGRAIALLLRQHLPWSVWLIVASAMTTMGGYALYHEALLLALAALALTMRLIYRWCLEALDDTPRGAIARTLAHQGLTWGAAAVYLDRAVGLLPRLQGLFA